MNDKNNRAFNDDKKPRVDKKPKIKEAIVVEGRDDTLAVSKAVDAIIIETHGFGLSDKTWKILDKAYRERGLIILTDPDHGGKSIRRKILNRFPGSKEAFVSTEKASKNGDVGIENAAPDDIWEALSKARASLAPSSGERTKERYKNSYEESHKEQYKDTHKEGYDMSLLVKWNLVGESNSRKRREVFCDNLGIGYSNAKGLLKKLNQYEIGEAEIESALSSIYCNDILEER
ncbi:MAG: toprim domain-containing protein [Christensenellales bacterium]